MNDLTLQRTPGSEPVPGYRLLEPLGRGGFGEVWKCEAPGGLLKAIKFVRGGLQGDIAPINEELQAIERVKAIRHPFLLSMERVECINGELVIVMELADYNLAEVLGREQQAGQSGIPRETLLGYLREAAEALDVMNQRYELQHLDIKPQNLFLVGNHVKVGDFGLCTGMRPAVTGGSKSAHLRSGMGAITPLYASPEVFEGTVSPSSDQYSLAIVYQELLTGVLPFTGKNARHLLILHLQHPPDLTVLPEADRPVVARALAKKPEERFPSCSDFIHALVAGQTEVVSRTVVLPPDPPPASPPRTPSRPIRSLASRPPVIDGPADLQLGALVGRTPLTEVWDAHALRDGEHRHVKIIYGLPTAHGEPVDRFLDLQHPSLWPLELLQQARGRLVLSTPVPERTWRDVLVQARSEGLPGVPRARLLPALCAVAEILTELAGQELFHFLLSPRTLVLKGDQTYLADFGLAQLLWLPAGQSIAGLNSRYSAPELADAQTTPSAAADQYSLALIYHELLTGTLPVVDRSRPDRPFRLDRLPASDRPVLARALDSSPRRRFESTLAMLDALASQSGSGGALPLPEPLEEAPLQTAPQEGKALQTHFGTMLSTQVIRERLEGFRNQWQATMVSSSDYQFHFNMQTPRSFWQRWTARRPGLDIHIALTSAPDSTEVSVEIRPRDCTREQSNDLLKVVGPLLVQSVRGYLQVQPRGRSEERLTWQYMLQLRPLGPNGYTGPSVECQGKDISLNGIGFYLPGQLPSPLVELNLPHTEQTPELTVRARIVRVQGCGDGWYEVGAVLLTPRGE
jgi:serine/threonine protein kinase